MAVDEALLLSHARGGTPPTLRLYTWEPWALSLGYLQDAERQVDLARLRRAGYGLVRRPTGGRAVLHGPELTYSVVVDTELLPGSVVETYRVLSQGLAAGLRRLGVEVESLADRERARLGYSTAVCFETPSWYELMVEGRKLVGSAQVRRHGCILQHGSILLHFDPEPTCNVLRFRDDAARARACGLVRRSAVGLGQVLPSPPSPAEVGRAVADGFRQALGVELLPAGLTPAEEQDVRRLEADKYGSEEWTLRPQRPPETEPETGPGTGPETGEEE